MTGLLLLLLVFALVGLGFALAQIAGDQAKLRQYAVISDFEKHRKVVREQVEAAGARVEELRKQAASYEGQIATLRDRLVPGQRALDLKRTVEQLSRTAREEEARLEDLRRELGSVEEAREIQSFGLYQPRFNYATTAEFRDSVDAIRQQQKDLAKTGGATHCPSNWTIDGSVAKGKRMVDEQAKLMLRAFNGECDASIAKVKYNNVVTLGTRVRKSFEAINKLGKSKEISITQEYLASRLEELHLVHELQEKLHAEREEQRAIKQQMREEERAQRELEKAQADAEKEAELREKALEQARRELAESSGQQHDRLEQLVNKLESELKDAIDRKAKAVARAQLTKSGHVYVISNIGSFGEGCFKIGLTRRLDPMERVWELSDASVPFDFDVHAMIWSENAPELENALHKRLAACRVNKVNNRKEFFRIELDHIREAVEELHGRITFVTVPEAEDYRKTLAIEREAVDVAEDIAHAEGIRLAAPMPVAGPSAT